MVQFEQLHPRGLAKYMQIDRRKNVRPGLIHSISRWVREAITRTTSWTEASRSVLFSEAKRINEKSDPGVFDLVFSEETSRTQTNSPNLILNTPRVTSPVWETRLLAAVGLALQSSILIVTALDTYIWKLSRRSEGSSYSYPCFALGTFLLAVGLLLCVHVVDATTEEHTIVPRPVHKDVIIQPVWVQPACRVGEKEFPACAIFNDPGQNNIRFSRLSPNIILQRTTLVGSIIAIIGYAVQFVGLRALPWYVGVWQLGGTLFLAMIRSWLRRGLSRTPRNIILDDEGSRLGSWKLACGILGIRYLKIPLTKETVGWLSPAPKRDLYETIGFSSSRAERTTQYIEPCADVWADTSDYYQSPSERFQQTVSLARDIRKAICDEVLDSEVSRDLAKVMCKTLDIFSVDPHVCRTQESRYITFPFDVLVHCFDQELPSPQKIHITFTHRGNEYSIPQQQIDTLFVLANIRYGGKLNPPNRNGLYEVSKILGPQLRKGDFQNWIPELRSDFGGQLVPEIFDLGTYFQNVHDGLHRENDVIIGYHLLPQYRYFHRIHGTFPCR